MDFYGLRNKGTTLAILACMKRVMWEHIMPWFNPNRHIPPVHLTLMGRIQSFNRPHLIFAGGFIAGGIVFTGLIYVEGQLRRALQNKKERENAVETMAMDADDDNQEDEHNVMELN